MPMSTIVQRRLSAVARREHDERGATVLEWALIAAVVVVAASIIAAVIFNIVQKKSSQLDDCANKPVGGAACSP